MRNIYIDTHTNYLFLLICIVIIHYLLNILIKINSYVKMINKTKNSKKYLQFYCLKNKHLKLIL